MKEADAWRMMGHAFTSASQLGFLSPVQGALAHITCRLAAVRFTDPHERGPMPANTLPIWLQYSQTIAAIAVPFIGAVLAAIGARIALQQMWIARSRLRHDLYERRYAIFVATCELLREIAVHEDVSEAAIHDYLLQVSNAPFLLDGDLVRYLREIGERASALHVTNYALKASFDEKQKSGMMERVSREVEWLCDQNERLIGEFQRFLTLENP